MKEVSLKEVCKITGVSRRAVQGYEENGLVSSTGHNKYMHNLYNEDMVKRIATIKQYQRMGFKVKEIAEIIDLEPKLLAPILEKKIEELYEKQNELAEIIQVALEMRNRL